MTYCLLQLLDVFGCSKKNKNKSSEQELIPLTVFQVIHKPRTNKLMFISEAKAGAAAMERSWTQGPLLAADARVGLHQLSKERTELKRTMFKLLKSQW